MPPTMSTIMCRIMPATMSGAPFHHRAAMSPDMSAGMSPTNIHHNGLHPARHPVGDAVGLVNLVFVVPKRVIQKVQKQSF